jgi:hypothetical protein
VEHSQQNLLSDLHWTVLIREEKSGEDSSDAAIADIVVGCIRSCEGGCSSMQTVFDGSSKEYREKIAYLFFRNAKP